MQRVITEAENYIKKQLSDGAKPFRVLERGTHISARSLQRAAKLLKIRRSRVGLTGVWIWGLAKPVNQPDEPDEFAHLFSSAKDQSTTTKEVTMPRWRIEQEPSERFIIVNANDKNLVWAGSHWFYRDQPGPPVTSFADRAAAERYAREILGR